MEQACWPRAVRAASSVGVVPKNKFANRVRFCSVVILVSWWGSVPVKRLWSNWRICREVIIRSIFCGRAPESWLLSCSKRPTMWTNNQVWVSLVRVLHYLPGKGLPSLSCQTTLLVLNLWIYSWKDPRFLKGIIRDISIMMGLHKCQYSFSTLTKT